MKTQKNVTRNSAAIKLAINHYFAQLKESWVSALFAFTLPGIGSILIYYVPSLIIARIIGRYGNTSFTLPELVPYIAAFAGVWMLGELIWRVGLFALIKGESRGIGNLYNNALDYLVEKDLGFFNDNFAGSLTKKVTGYAKSFEMFVDVLFFNVFSNLIPLLFVSYILWGYSPWLIAALIGLMIIAIMLIRPFIIRRQHMVVAREVSSNTLTGHVADTIGNMAAVKTFAHEAHEIKMHRHNTDDLVAKSRRAWNYQNTRIDMIISPIYVLINVVGLVMSLIISRRTGQSMEAVFVTFSFFAAFTRIMWEFNRIYRNLESSITEAAQFTELLLQPPAVVDTENPERFSMNEASIELNHVTFQYLDKSGEHLFKDLDIAIKPGEKVGLVGRSGGGKTTITKLLLRLMDIQSGEILISSQNIAHVKQRDFRKHISYVPQEPLLFHRSIADNIRYGRLDASVEDVQKVAKLAHAHEFIKDLPDGYDTMVGERGVKLSGGQRQRIAIARAMIKDAPILLLDEATSALDSESEVLIQDALWKLMEDRTAVVIAHRLSTIQHMDRIIVLDKGQIVEQGTHQELLAHKGQYAQLWAHQSGGFIDE